MPTFHSRSRSQLVPSDQNIRVYLQLGYPDASLDQAKFNKEVSRACISFFRNDADDAWLNSPAGLARLRTVRARLAAHLDASIRNMSEQTLVPYWTTHALLTLLLLACMPGKQALRDVDALMDARLGIGPLSVGRVCEFSVSEWCDAVAVLRGRLRIWCALPAECALYLDHLEARAAQFAFGMALDAAYDDPKYVKDGAVNSTWLLSAAGWLVSARRYIWHAQRRPPKSAGAFTPERNALWRHVFQDASLHSSLQYQEGFMNTIYNHFVLPGDLLVDGKVYGIGGLELGDAFETLNRTKTAVAASYCGRLAFDRCMSDWMTDYDRGDAFGGPDAERWTQTLAFLYVFEGIFFRFAKVSFLDCFLVTHEGAGARFEQQITVGTTRGDPFLVQRLGTFDVVLDASGAYASHDDVVAAVAHWCELAKSRDTLAAVNTPLRHFLTFLTT